MSDPRCQVEEALLHAHMTVADFLLMKWVQKTVGGRELSIVSFHGDIYIVLICILQRERRCS